MTNTRRICKGIYSVTSKHGDIFEVEKYPDAMWLVFTIKDGHREFCNEYCTLSDAKDAVYNTYPKQ